MKTWKLNPSRNDPAWLVLIGPYDEAFLKDFKCYVPYADRHYRDALKAWTVTRDHEDKVRELIEEHTVAEDPSDLIGLAVVADCDGVQLGTVARLQVGKGEAKGQLQVSLAEVPASYDKLRREAEHFGEYASTAEVWEALELIGTPESVIVRKFHGHKYVLAELKT